MGECGWVPIKLHVQKQGTARSELQASPPPTPPRTDCGDEARGAFLQTWSQRLRGWSQSLVSDRVLQERDGQRAAFAVTFGRLWPSSQATSQLT